MSVLPSDSTSRKEHIDRTRLRPSFRPSYAARHHKGESVIQSVSHSSPPSYITCCTRVSLCSHMFFNIRFAASHLQWTQFEMKTLFFSIKRTIATCKATPFPDPFQCTPNTSLSLDYSQTGRHPQPLPTTTAAASPPFHPLSKFGSSPTIPT